MEKWNGANMQPNQKWTQPMLDFMAELGVKGHSFAEIARQVNIRFGTSFSRNAAIGVATRKGLFIVQPKRRERNNGVVPVLKRANNKPTSLKRAKKLMTNLERLARRRANLPEPKGPLNDFPAGDACLFIHGDPMIEPWQCCAHKRLQGSPYCAGHHAVCTSVDVKSRMVKPLARQFIRR